MLATDLQHYYITVQKSLVCDTGLLVTGTLYWKQLLESLQFLKKWESKSFFALGGRGIWVLLFHHCQKQN